MNDAPIFRFTEQDNTVSVAAAASGISGIQGKFLRGPINNPNEIFFGWEQFKRVYGGFSPTSDDPLIVFRALSKGANLRINRDGHYADITDETSLDAVKATLGDYYYAVLTNWTSGSVTVTIEGEAISVAFDTDLATSLKALKEGLLTHSFITSFQTFVSSEASDTGQIYLFYTANKSLTVNTGWAVSDGVTTPHSTLNSTQGISDLHARPMFSIAPKHPGIEYNKMVLVIKDASNGDSRMWDMFIYITGESETVETYTNFSCLAYPTDTNSTYLQQVTTYSLLADITYVDLDAFGDKQEGFVRPANGIYSFINGSDGSAIQNTDIVGYSSARNGLHAFDEYDDMMQITHPNNTTWVVHKAGAEYASSRKDLMFWAHVDPLLTPTQIIAARQALGLDNSYIAWFVGGLKINHPQTGAKVNISEIGDILGLAAVNDKDEERGEWIAFYNERKGLITNCLGVVANYGGSGDYDSLNLLHQNGINAVIQRKGKVMLWGNATGYLQNSIIQKLNVRRLGIKMRKDLTAFLQRYLSEPNDIPTWLIIYTDVYPYLKNLQEKRAYYTFDWQGDQFAANLNTLNVNNKTQVQQGKYKVKLRITPIPAMGDFLLELNLDTVNGSVTVEGI